MPYNVIIIILVLLIVTDYYYTAFNAPCVGHKDDESQPIGLRFC